MAAPRFLHCIAFPRANTGGFLFFFFFFPHSFFSLIFPIISLLEEIGGNAQDQGQIPQTHCSFFFLFFVFSFLYLRHSCLLSFNFCLFCFVDDLRPNEYLMRSRLHEHTRHIRLTDWFYQGVFFSLQQNNRQQHIPGLMPCMPGVYWLCLEGHFATTKSDSGVSTFTDGTG